MSCSDPKPIYLPHTKEGIGGVASQGDGYTIAIDWTQAFQDVNPYLVIYNIYYSTVREDVFTEGVKGVWITGDGYVAYIPELTPGDVYFFAVRATEYSTDLYNPNLLPDGFPGLKVYPETVLLSPITDISTSIPIADIAEFPPMGVIQVGLEFIKYSSKDVPTESLLVANPTTDRGFLGTEARLHAIDGYDGYEQQDPIIRFWKGFEEQNENIQLSASYFAYPNFPRTNADGYRNVNKDNLNTNLSSDNAAQQDFVPMDYVGWRRTDPVALLKGDCVGTYYGGEQFCADGYGVGFQVRGVPFNEENDRRQEELLNLEGEPCVLVKRLYTGVTCSCYEFTRQNPALRCPNCFGTGFVTGYDQFFDPRRSDGRIMVRFDPTEEDIKIDDEGLESSFLPNCWTLTVPAVKSRDFLIRFNFDGTEEFRYEIISVTRNMLLNQLTGAQKFKVQRMRKTDPIYQWRAIRDTSTIPQTITTGVSLVPGPGGIPFHTHNIVISEKILTLAQVNETTSISQGHNHPIINGVVQPVLGHTHTLTLP